MVSPISAARPVPHHWGRAARRAGGDKPPAEALRFEPRSGSRECSRRRLSPGLSAAEGEGFLYEGRQLRAPAGLRGGLEPLRGACLGAGGWHIWRQPVCSTWCPRPAWTPTGPPSPGGAGSGESCPAGSTKAGPSAAPGGGVRSRLTARSLRRRRPLPARGPHSRSEETLAAEAGVPGLSGSAPGIAAPAPLLRPSPSHDFLEKAERPRGVLYRRKNL
ncbi:uncharacterized protein LOC123383814 [Felis catus]|uniref:uncharacterized protein LOC123383814 n=1 Tax=Felis catus TaxID=9685 RepID=UPI001D19CBBA|nr:uncharacterized protein LOC123383814 [Felis catus]